MLHSNNVACMYLHVSSLNFPVSSRSDDENDSDSELEINSSQASKNSWLDSYAM